MTSAHSRLLLLARLRTELLGLHRDGRLSAAELEEKSADLDQLMVRTASALEPLPFEELLDRCEESGLTLDLAGVRSQLRAGVLERIRRRRDEALREGHAFLDLEAVYPGIRRIPLRSFSWHDVAARLEDLLAVLRDPESTYPEALEASKDFFRSHETWALPAQLPMISRTLVRRLLSSHVISSSETSGLVQDLRRLAELARSRSRELSQHALRGGEVDQRLYDPPSDAAYRFLMGLSAALPGGSQLDTGALIVQWPGPSLPVLALAWFQRKQGETAGDQERKANLVVARTGLDPLDPEVRWSAVMRRRAAEERQEHTRLMNRISQEKTSYELALVLSAESVLGERVASAWWPLVESLRRPAAAEVAEPLPVEVPEALSEMSETSDLSDPMSAAVAEPVPEAPEEELQEHLVPEDDVEMLVAPPPAPSAEDRLVEEKSAWNVYLRPFLSENWLGLMGVFSLMAAWMFLTLWLWDKGQTYRILGGVVPLFFLTGGSAFISRFMQEIEDATPKAIGLFSSLAFLSVPFNFALAASILQQGSAAAVGIALALAAGYSVALAWLGQSIAASFGHNPWRFLAAGNLLIFLPPLVVIVAGEALRSYALAAMLFASYLVLVGGLLRAQRTESSFRFCLGIFGVSFVLTNAIPHVYYGEAPHLVTLAVLLQLAAPAITFFGRHGPTSIVTAAGASILGLLLALNVPLVLPLALALATAFWFVERRHVERPAGRREGPSRVAWPNEVLALHFMAFAGSVVYALALAAPLWPWVVAAALGAIVALEARRSPTETLTWALPLFMAGTVVCDLTLAASSSPVPVLVLLAVTFVYAYRRYVTGYRVPFWFVNVFLFLGLVFAVLWTGFDLGPRLPPLYTSVAALAWALLAVRLKDAVTTAHRTLVLWCLAFVSAGAGLFYLVAQGLPLDPVSLAAMLAALTLAAKRSRSQVPVYMGLALVAMTGQRVWTGPEFLAGTGLVAAITALGLTVIAWLLARFQVFGGGDTEPDRLFNRPFPGRSDVFLTRPFEVSALILALAATAKALAVFGPIDDHLKAGLALLVSAGVLAQLAYQFRSVILGYLWHLPFAAFLASLTLSLPLAVRFSTVFVWIALFHLARVAMRDRGTRVRAAIGKPFGVVTQALTYATVPAAFLAYPFLVREDLAAVAVFAVAAVVFSHVFLTRLRPAVWCQVVFFHVAVAWSAGFLQASFLQGTALVVPWTSAASTRMFPVFFGGLFLLLALPNLWESTKSPLWRAYAKGAQPWLALLAMAFTVVSHPWPGIGPTTAPATLFMTLAASWLFLQVGNREWRSFLLVLFKGFVCWWIAWPLVADPLAVTFLGMVIFFLLEALVKWLDPVLGSRLDATPTARGQGTRRSVAVTLHLFVGAVLGVHLFQFLDARLVGEAMLSHFWLYGLIPFCFLLYRMLALRYLIYLGLALFAYANSFYAAELLPFVAAYDLTKLHLVSLAFVVSIGGYLVAGSFLRHEVRP